jgi:hypothetical protein
LDRWLATLAKYTKLDTQYAILARASKSKMGKIPDSASGGAKTELKTGADVYKVHGEQR